MSDLTSAALRLHALGYDPLALVPGEKRPLASSWQRQHGRTPDEVAADFAANPGAGLGILTGQGLVVIDCDYKPDQGVNGEAAVYELMAKLGPLPPTVMARTAGGGMHRYYRVPAGVRVPNSASKLGPGIDVRGDGGQVVAPPTVLADGRTYRWTEAHSPSPISVPAELPARWLEVMAAPAAAPAAPLPSAGPAASPSGVETLTAPVRRADGLARARGYLASMAGAVAGQGGHGKTFDAACRAVERCTCVEDAWSCLVEWNAKCQPPWTEAELRHKLDGALLSHSLASALAEPSPAAADGGVAEDDDERIDAITEADNAAYWGALRAYNRDNPAAKLAEVLDEHQAAKLKRAMRSDTNGKPGPYLDGKVTLLDFVGMRPSQYAFDEHKTRPWRRLAGGRWSDGTGHDGLEHELTHAGLNKRSRDEFRKRTRHVADALHVYDSDRRFCEVEGEKVLNVYEPSTLQPEAGDWTPIREVLLNLHSNEQAHLDWTLDWLATVMQDVRAGKPRLTGVAVVFYGPTQGAGKGVMAEVLRALVGYRNLTIIRQQELNETFNGWAAGKLLIVGNEVFSSDNRTEAESNRLKPYISDPTIQVRELYAAVRERTNVANWWFFANGLRPVVAETQDRRFTMFRINGAITPTLGAQVADDARAGGPIVRAFLHELLNRVVTRFHRFTPLSTEAKCEVQYDVSSSAEKFLHDLLKGDGFHALAADYLRECGPGELYVRLEGEVVVERRILYEVYKRWAGASGYRPVAASQLYRLARSAGVLEERRRWDGQQGWVFARLPGLPVPEGVSITPATPARAGGHPNITAARATLEAP